MSQQPAKKGESSGNSTGNASASAKPAKGKGKGNKSKGPKPGSKEPAKKAESQKTGPKKSDYVDCALLFVSIILMHNCSTNQVLGLAMLVRF
ncbi:hypothetical protein SNK05_006177 [Fusarium graminearum]